MNDLSQKEIELICVIVNESLARKVIRISRQNGVTGATVFYGSGTVKSKVLELLDLNEVRKEIVLMVADKQTATAAINQIVKELKLDKPNHGIAFTTTVSNLIGLRRLNNFNQNRSEGGSMYKAIFTIVERGNAHKVIESANEAGAKGGTVINARGSGIHETSKLFAMEIEPEKEVVLILAETNTVDAITEKIKKDLEIEKPGNGIVFLQDVNNVWGLSQ